MKNKLEENIGFIEKVAYGSGDVGCNFIYVLVSTYITFFYTDALGLNAAIVGSIIMFSKFADGVTDILMGYIVDRTKSRHGKARVWVMRVSLPITAGMVLAFLVPGAGSTASYVYVAVTYNFVNTICYTAINLPYGTLNSLMTRDQNQRMLLNTYRMTMAQVASTIINMCTIPFVNAVGGTSKQSAWLIVVVTYAVLAETLFLFCFFKTKERVQVAAAQQVISVLKSFQIALKNKYWLILVIIGTMQLLAVAISGAMGNYYAKYILENENIIGILNSLNSIPALILMPFLPIISKKIGKRNIALTGGLCCVVGQAMMLLSPESSGWLIVCSFVKGVGSVFIMGTVFAMIADTIEYGEWKTGIRVEGVLYASSSFGSKIGAGVGSALAMGILGSSGYDGLAAVQSAETLSTIRSLYLYYPLVLFISLPILFLLYKLDKIYPQIMEDLMNRERRGKSE